MPWVATGQVESIHPGEAAWINERGG